MTNLEIPDASSVLRAGYQNFRNTVLYCPCANNMDFDFKTLATGKDWIIQWKRIRGKESLSLDFGNDTVLDSALMDAIREHRVWHLYCHQLWAGGDLSVFRPVADIIEKVSLSCDKGTLIRGLNTLPNLKELGISGNLTEVDFTQFRRLRSLELSEKCKGGNWHLCESLDFLLIDVSTPNLRKLKALKNLRSLSCGRGLKSFEGIADLPALRELRVGGCHLPSLESLGRLPNLRLLLLNLMPKLESLAGIECLPNLEELDVTQCGRLRNVSAMSSLTKLKKLALGACPHVTSIKDIKLPKDCKVSFVPDGKVSDGFEPQFLAGSR